MKKLLLIISLILIIASLAEAGPSTSGGGFAIVCRNTHKVIQSAELIDLYEARHLHGFQLFEPSGNTLKDYARAIKNGYRHQGYNPPISDEELSKNAIKFMNIVQWLPKDEKLPNLNDLGETIKVPEGCFIESLAVFYDNQNVVSIDQEIWESLNSLSQAALIIHEINYHYMRQMALSPDTNSSEVRVMVATDFAINLSTAITGVPANLKLQSIYHECKVASRNPMICGAQSTSFYQVPLSPNDQGAPQFRFQFTHLAGRPLKVLTTLEIPQTVNFGDIYPIKSRQLIGWTAEIAKDSTRSNGIAIKLLIRRGTQLILELPL